MKTIRTLLTVAVLTSLCSCSEKKQTAEEQVVRVKVQQLHAEVVNGEQGFSGTIEEASGAALSFASTGTIKRIYVSAGQRGLQFRIAPKDLITVSQATVVDLVL